MNLCLSLVILASWILFLSVMRQFLPGAAPSSVSSQICISRPSVFLSFSGPGLPLVFLDLEVDLQIFDIYL